MKKSFLIAGLVACIGVTNSYADIVISQTDDNPDTVITVARAAKAKAKLNTKGNESISESQVKYLCPEGCSVSIRGTQLDGADSNITMEYASCFVNKTGGNCGTPGVEIVNLGNQGINYKPGLVSREPVPDGVGYWDDEGNFVNTGKRPR